ncbi:unnamed protein product, partial [Timema podura]|nr:unnamed protein product [Timema podura]
SGEAEGGTNNELTMANVGGMFVVLVVGCCAAFLVAILEFLWNCRKIAVERKCKQDLGRYSGGPFGSANTHQHLSMVDLLHGFYVSLIQSGSKMSYPGQILFLLLSCFILLPSCPALPDVIPIGGVFHPESNDHQDVAFQYAVERINMDSYLLPHSRLERHIANVSFVDSFTTGKRGNSKEAVVCNADIVLEDSKEMGLEVNSEKTKYMISQRTQIGDVCDLMEVGVTAVFGPESDRSKGIVRSICDTLEIPNLQTNWRGSLKLDAPCQLNMHPDPDAIALALVDVLKFLSWKSFAIVYESNEGLMRLQEVFKSRDKLSAKISVYQLSMDGDHRSLFKDIHDSTQTHILLDCATDNIMHILRQAKEVDMFGDYENYFITSLDAHTLDFSEFEHLQTNVTFLRLIDPNSPEVINAVNDWVHGEREYGRVLNIRPETVRVEAALMYDAVNLFAKAITQLDNNNPYRSDTAQL